MANVMHSVGETQQFRNDATDVGLSEDQVKAIVDRYPRTRPKATG